MNKFYVIPLDEDAFSDSVEGFDDLEDAKRRAKSIAEDDDAAEVLILQPVFNVVLPEKPEPEVRPVQWGE
jgi:hypothetical protein